MIRSLAKKMFKIAIIVDGVEFAAEAIGRKGVAVRQAINRTVIEYTDIVAAKARANASGGVLQSRSGALAASIKARVDYFAKETVTGTVTADTPYARIQDQGGTTKPHIIAPRNAGKYLEMVGREGELFYRGIVHHPGSKMNASLFLTGAMEDSRDGFIETITGRVSEAMAS
jgi:hypothetical protein